MIELDGSFGEGGGQILRSSLALSGITGKPLRLFNIRGGRKKPGLLRQHLTCVRAAAEITGAELSGDALRSSEISFVPGPIRAGDYHFSIGTAGSTSLVLQTILPLLWSASEPSRVILEGGTHNQAAPPFEFLSRCFFPVLKRIGIGVEASLERFGFYPAGGGRVCIEVQPARSFKKVDLLERGDAVTLTAESLFASISSNVAERELDLCRRRLTIPEERCLPRKITNSLGPGNVLFITANDGRLETVVSAFGTRGVTAERVAADAIQEMRAFLAAQVPVCEYLADQLLLPMALAGGGSFLTVQPSLHTQTNITIINQFLDIPIRVAQQSKKAYFIAVGDP